MKTNLAALTRARALGRTGDGRRIREDLGISVRELATHIGVHPSTLSRWETGNSTPRSAAARHWMRALSVLQASAAVPMGTTATADTGPSVESPPSPTRHQPVSRANTAGPDVTRHQEKD